MVAPLISKTPRLIVGACLAIAVLVWVSAWIAECIIAQRSRLNAADTRGRIASPEDWPDSLVGVVRDTRARHIKLEPVTLYHGLNDDYVLVCSGTPEVLGLLIARWDLRAVTGSHKLVRLVQRRIPPAISFSDFAENEYYVSAEFLDGEDGDLYCVINDRPRRKLVIWYYYNF